MENLKKEKLVLNFIEEGRLNEEQLKNIAGGGISCGTRWSCAATDGNSGCLDYKNCHLIGSRSTCDIYLWD